ncbi:ABC transporter permease [Actinomyces lilanjuaniae]|uniref:ABC transporter permease n=1 Tax=Actinomyces lilanjuaniae TaxID=2321394 RepID=A0ABN5PNR7_9ACTO|nr:ABC transporter permease [Actinomyces lilanjuaniae]AYD89971.1 ABC transporter permease [Actinomyces lilanjuaniae]
MPAAPRTAETSEQPRTTNQSGSHEQPAGAAVRGAWLVVAGREISVQLRSRTFLVTVVTTALGLMITISVSGFIASLMSGSGAGPTRVAVTDEAGARLVQRAQQLAEATEDAPRLEAREVADEAAARQDVLSGEAELAVVTEGGGSEVTLMVRSDPSSPQASLVAEAWAQLRLEDNASAQGVPMEALLEGTQVREVVLAPGEPSPGTVRLTGWVLTGLFYLLAVMFGAQLAQVVLEEKQNRVVEIIASLVPVRSLLYGKLVGSWVVSVVQVTAYACAALVGFWLRGSGVDLSRVSTVLVWFVVLLAAGLVGTNALWAVAGSMSTRSEDLAQTATPVTLLLMAVLPVGFLTTGPAATVLSFIPLANVAAMPTRMLAGGAAWWEPVLSLVITLAVFTPLLVMLATAVYRRSLMQTQGRLTMRQALRLPAD